MKLRESFGRIFSRRAKTKTRTIITRDHKRREFTRRKLHARQIIWTRGGEKGKAKRRHLRKISHESRRINFQKAKH